MRSLVKVKISLTSTIHYALTMPIMGHNNNNNNKIESIVFDSRQRRFVNALKCRAMKCKHVQHQINFMKNYFEQLLVVVVVVV